MGGQRLYPPICNLPEWPDRPNRMVIKDAKNQNHNTPCIDAWQSAFFGALIAPPTFAQKKYRPVRPQYIAALAPAGATSGTDAETWGIWRVAPGPIGVWLRFYKLLRQADNIAPAGWRFNIDDWWLDANGLIMRAPEFPISGGQYYITNGKIIFRN